MKKNEQEDNDNVENLDNYRIPINHSKTLNNCIVHEYKSGNKTQEMRLGKTASVIANEMLQMTGGWPKRCLSRLFVVIDKDVVFLDSHSALFGWLSGMGFMFDWNTKAVGSINKEEFFKHLTNSVKRYDVISEVPQFPPQDNTFYLDRPLPEPNNAIDRLIDMFKPATPEDRVYIKAMICTPFWGGPCGSRPAFVIDGPEDDTEGGRGVGKTTLSNAMTWVVGKSIDLDPASKWDDMTKRLLGATDERLVRWDNIKSMKLSSGSIEQLLTAEFVSGHRMFRGQTTMHNNFTYLMTFNGASLSKDLSQRVIHIRLHRPSYQAAWEENLRLFIKTERMAIISGAIKILQGPKLCNADPATRFALWERDVLFKCTSDPDVGKFARARQQGVDDDADLAHDIHETISSRIADMDQYSPIGMTEGKGDPSKNVYLLSKKFCTEIIQDVMGNGRISTRQACKILKKSNLEQIKSEVTRQGYLYYIYTAIENFQVTNGGNSSSPEIACKVKSTKQVRLNEWSKIEE